MSVGRLKEFELSSGKWSSYCEIVEQYFVANDIKDDKKVPILIASVGTATYELMVDLCSPKKPSTVKYADLIKIVAAHIQPKPSYLAERYKFRTTKQRGDESIAQFAATLKRLATTCDFKSNLDENLRDQFICGLSSEVTRQRLFCEEDNLDFKTAYSMAISLEAATRNAAAVENWSPCPEEHSGVHAVHTAAGYGRGAGAGAVRRPPRGAGRGRGWGAPPPRSSARALPAHPTSRRGCSCCGDQGHDYASCRFQDYVCKICLKKGHLKKACPNIRDANFAIKDSVLGIQRDNNSDNDSWYEDCEETGEKGGSSGLYHVELSGRDPVIAEVVVDGQTLRMHVDTGSPYACVSEDTYKKLFAHHRLQSTSVKLRGYDGGSIHTMGVINVSVKYEKCNKNLDLYVILNGSVPLLGREWLTALKMNVIVANSVMSIEKNEQIYNSGFNKAELIRDFKQVFNSSLGRHVSARATLRVRPGAAPVFRRARPLPLALRARVDAELERMERAGIISPVPCSDWASSLVVVIKNNGGLRICGDYKSTLNPVLEVDKYPLPRAEQLFNNLNGGKRFSKLDLKEAYMQIELSEESKKYTVVNTHRGLYAYNRLVYGVASAAAIFQRVIEQVVAGIPNVTVYQDDVLITGTTENEHLNNLKLVLSRFADAGLTLSEEKCVFFASEVKYLGFIISEKGVRTDDDKTKPIIEAPAPEHTTQLKSFLGMINFYSKFIKDFTYILSPLYELLRKGVNWEWGIPQTEAFNKIKEALTKSPVLTHYSEKLPLILCCDGSASGVGAVLLHRTPEGDRPVAFASRALSAPERNYSQIHREALSIIFGVKKFHTYLYGRHFTLQTDHRPLVAIFGPKSDIPSTAAGRLIRWAILLSGYQYDIEYVKSADNVADGLSRLPLPLQSESEASDDCSFVQFVENNFPIRALDIKKELMMDKTLRLVVDFVKTGWPASGAPVELAPFYKRRDELNIEGGCLIWGSRVVVPAALRQAVLAEVHGSHLGIVKCKGIARSYVWWPGIDLDIEKLCKSCPICSATADAPPRVPIVPWSMPKKAFDRIHIDFLTYNNKTYLIIVDGFSKWIEALPMTTTTAGATTDRLRELFARFGIPSKLVSDNGPPFSSDEFATFLKRNGIEHITSAPYHPASNGEAENAELAASAPTQRNWRGILIALLVIAAVLGLIVFSIALLTPAGDGGRVRGRRPTLQELLTDHYKPFNGTWLSDEDLVFRDRWGGLTLFNVRNFTTRLLMNNSTFRELNAVDFKVSADLKFVLLVSDVRAGWRHARLARYHVYDVINRNKIPISPIEDDRQAPLLQYAEWAPQGSSLVFVHDNDIYYKPRVLKNLVCRITNNGVPGTIFNGVPDFLYETQVLRLDRALWFSPDAQTLMFVSYNDSLVHLHQYPWYGLDEPEPPAYPAIRTLRYPKVNTNNPVATVYVVSLKTPKFLFPHAIQFTSQVDKDWYVRWTGWTSERQIAVLLLNRAQNVSIISVCSAASYNCQDILRDEADVTRWSGLGAEPEPECGWCGGAALVGGRGGLFTSAPVADRGGAWRHAVRVGPDGASSVTQGPFEVTQLLGWDERRKLLYVLGTAVDRPGERHLYRVSTEPDAQARCLTCADAAPPDDALADEPPELENTTSSLPAWPTATVLPHVADDNDSLPADCLYNRVHFSKNFSYYVQECLGPGSPAVFLCAASGERRSVLWDGEPLRAKFAGIAVPQSKVFRVEVQADREARVRLYLPPGFRETDDLPLPLVLHVSAEPGGQLVTERWQPGWGWYLAAARNFIVAEIDARGSGGQGEELRTEIYHKLLSVDVEDQIAVLSYLRDNLKMVDGARVGVWGRGYGAGAAAALVADDARNVTRCLAAIAPVTDLRHYNSFWTERYAGYGAHWAGALGAAAVWRRAGNLPPRRLLLAHAGADLAAPPAHALALARALIRSGAVYTHQIYPDEGHNFERSNIHLHKAMEQFFDECFGPVEVADWDVSGVGGLFPFRD